ncbi:hypothetical protein HKX48_006227 [Thoreauomyces humboldtii]|nr:hypothetical protein HKX48_006227 [Thoreauomyces humboldtii]
MVNQMNKVRKNLTRDYRAKKHGFKASSHKRPGSLVLKSNVKILSAIDSLNADVDSSVAEVEDQEGGATQIEIRRLEKKEQVVRSGKLGKNNSIKAPILLSKKKVRMLRTADKHRQARAAAAEAADQDADAMEVDMTAPATKAKVSFAAKKEEAPMVIAPAGKGSTLGGPR